MIKTTLYLPESLKAEVERLATESGRSEADIIREGIALAIERRPIPKPSRGLFSSGDSDFSERADELLKGFGER